MSVGYWVWGRSGATHSVPGPTVPVVCSLWEFQLETQCEQCLFYAHTSWNWNGGQTGRPQQNEIATSWPCRAGRGPLSAPKDTFFLVWCQTLRSEGRRKVYSRPHTHTPKKKGMFDAGLWQGPSFGMVLAARPTAEKRGRVGYNVGGSGWPASVTPPLGPCAGLWGGGCGGCPGLGKMWGTCFAVSRPLCVSACLPCCPITAATMGPLVKFLLAEHFYQIST